jgi:hypothetical protein
VKQLTKWYERPILCAIGIHEKSPHPSAPAKYWHCERCLFVGEYR